jgi:hypothetical protein
LPLAWSLSLPADVAERAATGGPVIAVVTAADTQFSARAGAAKLHR